MLNFLNGKSQKKSGRDVWRQSLFLATITVLAVPVVVAIVALHQEDPGEAMDVSQMFANLQTGSDKATSVDLWQESSFSTLPVASVDAYAVDGAVGTVFLLPQYHLDPSTEAGDKKNDLALRVQGEIYETIKFMYERGGVDLAMVEGELRGAVSSSAIDGWKHMVGSRNGLESTTGKLRNVLGQVNINEPLENKVLEGLENKSADVNRQLLLKGATQVLVGEGGEVQVWGLENESTLAESRPIIRDYVYLQDRIAQVSKGKSDKVATGGNNEKMMLLMSLLGKKKQVTVRSDLQQLEQEASLRKNFEVSELASKARGELGSLEAKQASSSIIKNQTARRSSNPYEDIDSSRQLDKLLSQTEEQIKAVVIDKRNREAAENARYALEETGEKSAMVQFGAGHTDGLVKEMNAQGLSVVVVTTVSVAEKSYETLDEEAGG